MMDDNHSKSKVLSSLFWKLMERGGTQGIQFIVQIILARLLFPKDYGLIAIVTIFILLANVFVQSGFNTALIQKRNADELDFSSVFYLSLAVAGTIYVALFFTAPSIARFYSESLLTPVLRVLSITLFFGALNSIQNAYVARNMMFKMLFYSSLGAIGVSGIVGIAMAYAGFGVWALVGQQLANQIMIALILWFTVKWRPRLIFSIERVKSLFSYGWKLLVSSLIDTFDRDIRSLIVGKIYSPAILGFYNRGKQFPELIVANIDGSIQAVLFPTLSAHQDDRPKVKNMVRRSIMTSTYLIFPMMAGLAAVAEPLVLLLLTEKWLPAVPFIQIFCGYYAQWPIHTANLQAINALGRSDIFLKLEIIKVVIGFSILLVSIQFGIYAIVWGGLIAGLVATFINSYPNLKLLDYSYLEQMRDIAPSFFVSIVMGAAVYAINFLNISALYTLGIQIALGAVIYIGLSKLLKLESYSYLIITINQMRNKS